MSSSTSFSKSTSPDESKEVAVEEAMEADFAVAATEVELL